MAKKNEGLTYEEKLEKSLVPDWEQPYKVPSNWVWTRLESVAEIITGGTPSKNKSFYYGGTFPFIKPADLDQGRFINFASEYLTDEGRKVARVIRRGATSVCCIGSIGKSGYLTFDATTNQQINSILPEINDLYIYYLSCTDYFVQELWKRSSATTISIINKSKMSEIQIPLPPLAEQQRIVERIESLFSKLDEAKEVAQMALDSFENRKVAILHKAFSGELSKKWREENGMSLGSWEKIPFEKIIESGPQNGLYKPQSAYGSGIKIIRIDSFYNGDIEPWSTIKQLQLVEAEINTYKLEIGDILVNRVNSMPYLGKSALIRELPEICVFESNIMRLTLDTKKALPEYIICYLNSSIGLEELKKNAKQAVNQASINQQDVKSAMISLPTVPEQLEIVRILDSIFGKERQAKEFVSVIDKIDNMKKSILARAFRGELGTNNPEEDSALKLLKEILSKENKTKQKPNKKTITIPSHISKQFKTDLEEQIYKIILEKQNSTLNQILSSISSSKHLDAMEVIAILYERGLINKRDDLYSTK